jgi:pilus assembly protein CpaE
MARVLLAVNDGHLLDHLYGLAAESQEITVVGTVREPEELRGGVQRDDLDAVIVHDARGAVPLIELTRELSVSQPDLGLVLVVAEESPDTLRSGMQAGARDVVSHPMTLDRLEGAVMAAAAWTQALRRRAARDAGGELLGVGRIITVIGAKGGVGTTTVATHLAIAATEIGAASVCLVEYDLQAGDLRSYLDLPYRRSVLDLVPVANELNARNLQESLYTHGTGMRVLLGPSEGERADEVTGAVARNILSAIRTREDLTIIDAGSALTDASAVAVEMADTAIIVSTPDVVSLRGVSRTTSLWERLKIEPPEVAVLLNRTSRRLEIQPELARRVVPIPVFETTVPAEFASLEAAANTGIPTAAAASDAMLKPMAALLGELSAVAPPEAEATSRSARTRSIAARLAGEGGQATIETIGILPLLALMLVVTWQIVLVGLTFVFAGHAARTGARALAVGNPVASAATSGLPGAWRDGAQVQSSTDIDGNGTVSVSASIPLLVPGLLPLVPVHSSAQTVIEDALLGGETNPYSILGSGGFGATGTVPNIVPAPLVPGNTAQMISPYEAAAPINAPPIVKQMIAAANAISHYQYCYGGGHNLQFAPSTGTDQNAPAGDGVCSAPEVGYDCSGATSFVLHAAGLLSSPLGSKDFAGFGPSGPGKWVTIYWTDGHVHIVIAGLNFDTADGGNGPEWNVTGAGSDWNGFAEVHPVGL